MTEQLILWGAVLIIGAALAFVIRANARHAETKRQLQREIDAAHSRAKTEDDIRKTDPDDRRRDLDEWMRDQ